MSSYTAAALKSELNGKDRRLTPQRKIILQVFQDLPQGEHLSAEDLYNRLQSQNELMGLSTVYRTLKLMARMGILRELHLGEGHKHYELNQPSPHHHHHLTCVRCHKTIEFKNNAILKICANTTQKQGFHLLDCQLTIQAVCPTCQRTLLPIQ